MQDHNRLTQFVSHKSVETERYQADLNNFHRAINSFSTYGKLQEIEAPSHFVSSGIR